MRALAVTPERIALFEAKVMPEPNTGCHLWMAALSRSGYGVFGKIAVRAHRFAWRIANGPIPEGLIVCHRCDTPSCVNPDHLFLGTHLDNARDRNAKGRQGTNGFQHRTHCKHGHSFTGDNIKWMTRSRDGYRYRTCRACHRLRCNVRSSSPRPVPMVAD